MFNVFLGPKVLTVLYEPETKNNKPETASFPPNFKLKKSPADCCRALHVINTCCMKRERGDDYSVIQLKNGKNDFAGTLMTGVHYRDEFSPAHRGGLPGRV